VFVLLVFGAMSAHSQSTPPLDISRYISEIPPRVRTIFRLGQRLGNRADVFAKVGDSITASNMSLRPLGEDAYKLGDYEEAFGDTRAYFSTAIARTGNSFVNKSLAAKVGWSASVVLNPNYADPAHCEEGESPLDCEYRLLQPSFAFIMLGTNDVGFVSEATYRHNLERVVSETIRRGIVPLLSTIPPRTDSADIGEKVVRFNAIVREVAQDYRIPLMDYYALMNTLPNKGLSDDGVHPNVPPRGYVAVADFNARDLQYGYTARNLLMLATLSAVWQFLQAEE
jgi:hypothetical protein